VNKPISLEKNFNMAKILGIGNALVDVLTILTDEELLVKFGLPKGSMQMVDRQKSEMIKKETGGLKRSFSSGGSAANTIHGLAMLGLKTGYIGSIGNDQTGDFFEQDLQSAGIETILSRRANITGTAITLISPDYERTFATHLGAAVELSAGNLKEDDFKNYDLIYIEGYQIFNKELVVTACNFAKNNNIKIALDLASYNVVEAKLDDFREITKNYIDILFANEEEARAFTGLDPENAINKLSEISEIAVVKTGKDGSLVKSGKELYRIGTDTLNVIDTTGAGDLYAAGFLYGYACGRNLEICGKYGSLVAGKVIEILGARMHKEIWNQINMQIPLIS
jgi:sugar/nucleoside kinase (ribokinase family)